MKQIFNVLLMRLQSSKTTKFSTGFLKLIYTLVCTMKPANFAQLMIDCLDSIQPKLFFMVMQGVLLKELPQITSASDRKACGVALTKILTTTTAFTQNPAYLELWPTITTEILKICQAPLTKDKTHLVEDQEELLALDADEAGYQSAFARLHSIAKTEVDLTSDVPDLKAFVKMQFAGALNSPNVRNILSQQLPPECKDFMKDALSIQV